MPQSTHEHLEEVEHAEHASHDEFTRKVATTMVIIAAMLTAVTLLSHRSHTETLRLQTLSNVLVLGLTAPRRHHALEHRGDPRHVDGCELSSRRQVHR